jgi:hypothetical protein
MNKKVTEVSSPKSLASGSPNFDTFTNCCKSSMAFIDLNQEKKSFFFKKKIRSRYPVLAINDYLRKTKGASRLKPALFRAFGSLARDQQRGYGKKRYKGNLGISCFLQISSFYSTHPALISTLHTIHKTIYI